MTPHFDVLVPFYGDVGLMRQAVESVVRQNHTSWRLVVLDDCYPDESTGPWLRSLSDARIEYHRSPVNLGINRAFQRLLDMSSSEYVVFMGCDDIMRPDYLASMAKLICTYPTAAMLQPRVSAISWDGRVSNGLPERVKRLMAPPGKEPLILEGEPLAVSLVRGNWTYFPAMCWRRDSISGLGFRHGYQVVQDLALMLDVISRGGQLVVDTERTFLYRRHQGSVSQTTAENGVRFREERDFFRQIRIEFTQRGWHKAARAAWLRPTSRLNAAVKLVRAVGRGQHTTCRELSAHVLGT